MLIAAACPSLKRPATGTGPVFLEAGCPHPAWHKPRILQVVVDLCIADRIGRDTDAHPNAG
jgi:hypothetical protein